MGKGGVNKNMKPNKENQFIIMRAEGYTHREIRDKLGISEATASRLGTKLRKEIEQVKQENKTALMKAYQATQQARAESIAGTLFEIDTALKGVDLKEVPLHRLLDLKLKYIEALKDELPPQDESLKRVDDLITQIDKIAGL